MNRLYGTGHRPDPTHVSASLRTSSAIAFDSASPLGRPVEFVRQVRDQKGTSSCVGQALAQGFACRARALGYEVPEISALAIYRMARIGEDPVVDDGSAPYQACYYAMARGVVPEARWPIVWGSDGWTATNVNDPLPLDIWQHALDARISEVGVIDLADRDAVKASIDAGFPIAWSTLVDESFDGYTSGYLPPPTGKNRGRHYTLLVDYDYAGVLGVNSWGTGWGAAYGGFPGGFYRASWDRLADASSTDGRIVDAGPSVVT